MFSVLVHHISLPKNPSVLAGWHPDLLWLRSIPRESSYLWIILRLEPWFLRWLFAFIWLYNCNTKLVNTEHTELIAFSRHWAFNCVRVLARHHQVSTLCCSLTVTDWPRSVCSVHYFQITVRLWANHHYFNIWNHKYLYCELTKSLYPYFSWLQVDLVSPSHCTNHFILDPGICWVSTKEFIWFWMYCLNQSGIQYMFDFQVHVAFKSDFTCLLLRPVLILETLRIIHKQFRTIPKHFRTIPH